MEQERQDPTASSQSSTEKYTGSGLVPGGTLGSTGTTTGNGKGKYLNNTKTTNNALGTETIVKQTPPGTLQNMSVAVLLNKSVKGVSLPAITNMIKSGIGYNKTRGDSVSVQSMAFNTAAQKSAAAAAAAAQAAAAKSASGAGLMSMIKQGALGLLVLGIVIITFFAARKRRKAAPPENDDIFGLDDPDLPSAPAQPGPMANDINDAMRRSAFTDVADNRPADVARVLSGWLNSKESGQ